MRHRLIAVLLLLIAIPLFTGCAGARETDDITYVLAIGIDRSKKVPKNYDVTYQIAVAKAIGTGGGGGGGEEQTVITVTVTAPNLAEARNLLNSSVSRIPNLAHNKIFIFGEELAREGIGDVIAPFTRFREFRGSMFIMVVNESTAKEFIDKNKPKLEALTSRYYESVMAASEETGYFLRTTLHDFYIALKSGSISPTAILGAVNAGKETPTPARPRMPGEKTEEFYAGNLPRGEDKQESKKEGEDPENAIDIMGTALFREDKMVGMLTGEETRMLAILRGEFPRGFIIVADPLVPDKSVNVLSRLGEAPKIKVRLQDGRVFIDIRIFLEGEVTALPSGTHYENNAYRTLLEQAVSNLVTMQMEKMLKRTQGLRCDPVGFGFLVQRKLTKNQEWQELRTKWLSMYQQAEISLTVETRIRRYGLMFRTSPIVREE